MPRQTPLDGAATPATLEHQALLGESMPATVTYLAREYVWGPGDWGVDELLVQYDQDRRASWPLQDAGGDVIALCDLGGTSGTARVITQIVYDAYGRVIGRDDPATPATGPPELRVGHKGLFFDRLDGGIADPLTGFDLPRLWPGARLSGYVRNRTLHCDFGRWNQPDPNATGLVVQGAFGFHGTGLTATVQSFRLGVHFGDGPNVYEYLGGMAWNADDPTGLSMWISTQLMMSASWGYLSSSRSHISARSSTGSISLAGQAIGQIAGAMYASWAMGDGWGANNQALWRNVSESVGLAGSTFVGGLLGAMVGGSAANAIGAWGVGAAGSGMGAGAFTAASGNSVGRVVFDVGVAICSTSLDMIRGVASAYTLGVSIGAGFYGGVVSYLADSAHDWWKR